MNFLVKTKTLCHEFEIQRGLKLEELKSYLRLPIIKMMLNRINVKSLLITENPDRNEVSVTGKPSKSSPSTRLCLIHLLYGKI